MSNMKNILGDMTLEEFEVKRKTVLEKFEGAKIEDHLDKLIGEEDEIEMFDDLYFIWLNVEGTEFANKRMQEDYGGHINIEQFFEYAQGLHDRFIEWLKSVI